MSIGPDVSLVLASASPRRRELLSRLGLPFNIIAPEVDEHEDPSSDPEATVRHNAELKARAVAEKHPEALVLGSDTAVAIDGIVLHKPADLREARSMLHRLSGRRHTVHTGVSLICRANDFEETTHHTSGVTFLPLLDTTIDRYFQIVNPLDKAGAYGIQSGRELIIAGVEGSVANVMGLPVEWLETRLQALGLIRVEA